MLFPCQHIIAQVYGTRSHKHLSAKCNGLLAIAKKKSQQRSVTFATMATDVLSPSVAIPRVCFYYFCSNPLSENLAFAAFRFQSGWLTSVLYYAVSPELTVRWEGKMRGYFLLWF